MDCEWTRALEIVVNAGVACYGLYVLSLLVKTVAKAYGQEDEEDNS